MLYQTKKLWTLPQLKASTGEKLDMHWLNLAEVL